MSKPILLCMFSGGVDSTGALYRLLMHDEFSKYAIHVHHIHMMNIERRDKAENLAVQGIVDYFRNQGCSLNLQKMFLKLIS